MIAPARRMCLLTSIPAVMTLLLFPYPFAWPFFAAIDGLILLIALLDLLSLPRKKDFVARRELGRIATRGENHPVAVIIENHSRRTFVGKVRDDRPNGLTDQDQVFELTIPVNSRGRLHYVLVPRRRGAFQYEHVHLQTESRFKLWSRIWRVPSPFLLRVYPALKQISRYALYARLNRMSLLGVRRQRRIGTDNEFERLRDYTPDDQFRAIDWRATSRRLKLTVRDFQSNQSQRVVFLVDCGRMMVNESGDRSFLDAAFDAVLTLAYVTLAQNDEAGLLCFSDGIVRWLPPARGRRQLNRMVQAVHDVHPQMVESQFDEAFLHLQRQVRKRTLVVLVTNLIDSQNADRMKAQVTNLVGRHLPLTVLLRDHELFDPVEHITVDDLHTVESGKLFRAAAAADILCWRRQVLTDLRHAGVLTLDCFPEDLTAPLINEYMRIKSQHLL